MKKYLRISMFVLVLLSMILQSCSIEKRRYTGGFHVDTHKSKRHEQTQVNNELEPLTIISNQTHELDTNKGLARSIADDVLIHPLSDQSRQIITTGSQSDVEPMKLKRETTQKIFPAVSLSKFKSTGVLKPDKLEENNNVGVDGVLSWIAFAFAVLSIAFVILAIIVNGWAGLGYIAMALVAGVITAILAIIAKIVTDHKQNSTPWNLWFALAVGAIWAIITIRILLEKG